MSAPSFDHFVLSLDEIEFAGSAFIRKNGDNEHGVIPDSEYDRLFDHLAEVLTRYGSFCEGSGTADFMGDRYVDQIPWITIVPGEIDPKVSLEAALEAVRTAHRPFAVAFDYYPDGLLIIPPDKVLTTFGRELLE